MTVLKEDSCSEFKMIAAIKQIIPKHAVLSLLSGQVVINLPDEDTDKFPDLFKMLENNRQQFCIKGMGISCTTMDEVFLRYFNLLILKDIYLNDNTPHCPSSPSI